ncbi:hypothetical protein Zm00014a_039665, partial [Zea mays]
NPQWEEQRERKGREKKILREDKKKVLPESTLCQSSLYSLVKQQQQKKARNTLVMRYFKEFKSPRFKSSTLILFKWGSVPVRFLLWRKKKKNACSNLSRTRSSKHMSFWMRSGHPSFVDEALEDQSRKESMWEFIRGRFVCWHRCFLNKLAAKQKPEA